MVESPADIYAIEQTGQFSGRYFVLMGHLSPLDGIGPDDIGLDRLEPVSYTHLMQLNISELLWSFSKKLAIFWLVFGLCWKVLEKNGVAVRHFGMPGQQTSHWRRQIVRISLCLLYTSDLVVQFIHGQFGEAVICG